MTGQRRWVMCVGVALVACNSLADEPIRAESWSADVTATRQVLFIAFTTNASAVTGTGNLSSLLSPGSTDALTLAGTRRADTLDVTLSRATGDRFRFIGSYTANGAGLSGRLSGAEFANTFVAFRRQ